MVKKKVNFESRKGGRPDVVVRGRNVGVVWAEGLALYGQALVQMHHRFVESALFHQHRAHVIVRRRYIGVVWPAK